MAREQGNRRNDRNRNEPAAPKEFDERVIHIDRVARVVKGGRRFRFRALVAVGDHKSRVGIGVAKGVDVTAAVSKATDVAKKNMVTLKLYKGTLPHEVQARIGASNILIKPAATGTGLIAGGVVRTVLEVGGVHNAVSKSMGSSNRVNTAYATVEALRSVVPKNQWITYRPTKKNEAKEAPAEQKPAKKAAAKKEQ